jgi:hypothetical protein
LCSMLVMTSSTTILDHRETAFAIVAFFSY